MSLKSESIFNSQTNKRGHFQLVLNFFSQRRGRISCYLLAYSVRLGKIMVRFLWLKLFAGRRQRRWRRRRGFDARKLFRRDFRQTRRWWRWPRFLFVRKQIYKCKNFCLQFSSTCPPDLGQKPDIYAMGSPAHPCSSLLFWTTLMLHL